MWRARVNYTTNYLAVRLTLILLLVFPLVPMSSQPFLSSCIQPSTAGIAISLSISISLAGKDLEKWGAVQIGFLSLLLLADSLECLCADPGVAANVFSCCSIMKIPV